MTRAYYNEIEPFAAEWLRNLIAAGLIADGDVDERDIQDVHPADLRGYTQCHFFAGIGAWSFALRLAGWPDDRPVWTGSCPCQPFSTAGRRDGFDDERHLWPAWHHLIWHARPPIIFGEQVASTDGWTWFDLVHTDMEGTGYACGAAVLPAASVGAPHIRHRLWFVADAERRGSEVALLDHGGRGAPHGFGQASQPGMRDHDGGLDNAKRQRRDARRHDHAGHDGQQLGAAGARSLADADAPGRGALPGRGSHGEEHHAQPRGGVGDADASRLPHAEPDGVAGSRWWEQGRAVEQPGRAFWSGAQWHLCRDSKHRAVEPGVFPVVDGAVARVGRLRAYGNAIVPWVAAEFVAAAMEARGEHATTLLDMME